MTTQALGMDLVYEYDSFGPLGGLPQDKSRFGRGAYDLRCVNASGSSLSGLTTACDWVELDWANMVRGGAPRIKQLVASGDDTRLPLGCVRWTEGTVADGKSCWVRVYGLHDFANVLGAASTAAGSLLVQSTTAGAVARTTTPSAAVAYMRETYTTTSVAAKQVMILNPSNVPLI